MSERTVNLDNLARRLRFGERFVAVTRKYSPSSARRAEDLLACRIVIKGVRLVQFVLFRPGSLGVPYFCCAVTFRVLVTGFLVSGRWSRHARDMVTRESLAIPNDGRF